MLLDSLCCEGDGGDVAGALCAASCVAGKILGSEMLLSFLRVSLCEGDVAGAMCGSSCVVGKILGSELLFSFLSVTLDIWVKMITNIINKAI